jgi:two-component system response regulator PilR (NtrC family)
MGASFAGTLGPLSDGIVGASAWTKRVRSDILRAAKHSSNVLITGPTGTGKELIARAVHARSDRANKPFIPVDCAAVVTSLFSSQVFGHLRGAFSGAEYEAIGSFRAADGGTLFLDEIGELDLETQAKLLRVLQERAVVPVGGVEPTPVDVRIVAATNRELGDMSRDGGFRPDLFYRLNVINLRTMPLCDRPEDIDVLASHFLTRLASENALPFKRLSPAAADLLRSFDWPGNARQLQNLLERAVIFIDGDTIEAEPLSGLMHEDRPQPVQRQSPREIGEKGSRLTAEQVLGGVSDLDGAVPSDSSWVSLDCLERYHIRQTLEYTFYNQSEAARLLCISRRVLAGKIKKLGLQITRPQPALPRHESSPPDKA